MSRTWPAARPASTATPLRSARLRRARLSRRVAAGDQGQRLELHAGRSAGVYLAPADDLADQQHRPRAARSTWAGRGVLLEEGSYMAYTVAKSNDIKPKMVGTRPGTRLSAEQFAKDSDTASAAPGRRCRAISRLPAAMARAILPIRTKGWSAWSRASTTRSANEKGPHRRRCGPSCETEFSA